jgi:hypothetical protein
MKWLMMASASLSSLHRTTGEVLQVYECKKPNGRDPGTWEGDFLLLLPILEPQLIMTNSGVIWTDSVSFNVLGLQWIPFEKFSEGPRNINLCRKIS